MHLIQNESRYSIEFRKGHFYRILYLNQYVYLNIHGQYMYVMRHNLCLIISYVNRRNRYFYLKLNPKTNCFDKYFKISLYGLWRLLRSC